MAVTGEGFNAAARSEALEKRREHPRVASAAATRGVRAPQHAHPVGLNRWSPPNRYCCAALVFTASRGGARFTCRSAQLSISATVCSTDSRAA